MAKLTNVRERIHQPFRDTLIRTSGLYQSAVQDRTELFTVAGKDDGQSNLKNGSTLPSDQSMVVLALRVFTWFRAPVLRYAPIECASGPSLLPANGDVDGTLNPCDLASLLNGQTAGDYQDVYRLHWQAEEQLLWSFGSGQKFSLTSMPTAYFPYGGGLSGDNGNVGTDCCDATLLALQSPAAAPGFSVVGAGCCGGYFIVTWQIDGLVVVWWKQSVLSYPLVVVWETGVTFPATFDVGSEPDGPPCLRLDLPSLTIAPRQFAVIGLQGADRGRSCSPLIHWQNGTPDHSGILRLARAILLPPRQNVLCQAQIVRLPDGGNGGVFGATQGSRSMLSLTDNLNAVDGVNKVVSFTIDGMFSRDVQ